MKVPQGLRQVPQAWNLSLQVPRDCWNLSDRFYEIGGTCLTHRRFHVPKGNQYHSVVTDPKQTNKHSHSKRIQTNTNCIWKFITCLVTCVLSIIMQLGT